MCTWCEDGGETQASSPSSLRLPSTAAATALYHLLLWLFFSFSARWGQVWDLLQRDFALQWAGVNSHFVLGMLGYMWLIATKAFFMGGGAPVFAIAMSGMLSMISIINRGVARGGGSSVHRYGSSIAGLLQTYVTLPIKRSRENFGPVEVLAFGVFAVSLCVYGRTVWTKVQSNAD